MRVAIVSSYRVGNETGTAKVSERLSKNLARNNCVLYFCLGQKYTYKKSTMKNLHYLKIPSESVSDLAVPLITPNTIKRVYHDLDSFNPEVIHSQNIAFTGLISLIWAKKRSVPYVLTFHSLPSEGLSYVFPKFKKEKIISTIDQHFSTRYIKELARHTDLIVALNKSVFNSLKKLKCKTNSVIINNGLELEKFHRTSATKLGENTNCIYLGSYLGRKNQEFLVRSFKYLPQNYKLDLFGNKKSGRFYVKKLQKMIKNEKIGNVFINDFLSEKGVIEAMKRSHYFVCASIKEVQSLVVIESLASGLPVIALKNETTQELLDGKNGITLPQSTTPKKFAKALKKFVEKTNSQYSDVSIYCRESVRRFDIKIIVDKLINSYQKAVVDKTNGIEIPERLIVDRILKYIPDTYRKDIQEIFPKPRKRFNILKILLSFTVLASVIFGGIFCTIVKIKGKKS